MRIKKSVYFILAIVVLVGVYVGKTQFWDKRSVEVDGTALVSKGETGIPDAPKASLIGPSQKLDLPTTNVLGSGIPFKWSEMAWNSQSGLNLANGGANTTEGSLVSQTGLNINIVRQDNPSISATELVNNIKAYATDKSVGGYAFTVMGSGAPMYFKSVYDGVKQAGLGPEYLPTVVFTFGRSNGEDQVIGDIKYKQNPQLLKGKVIRGVRLDGDLDLALKFCSDNNVPVNVNPETYDPNALNFSYSADFLSCVQEYNSGIKETRKIIKNGRTTGRDTLVGYDLVATWTPGDVNASNGRGGATIVSTMTYSSIMPNITIMCRKFVNDNREEMIKLTAALATAGDQVRSFESTKKYACKLNSEIFAEQTGDYWYTYFNGVKKGDIQLGGSMVFNLSDMNNMFGMNGKTDIYRAVYETFAKLQSKLYPEDFKDGFVPYNEVVDKSILQATNDRYPDLLKGKALVTDYSKNLTEVVSSKSVHINFSTNSDVINSNSFDDLNDIATNLIATEGLKISLQGHTDNVGNSDYNLDLSLRRANAVKTYLINQGVNPDRFEVEGFGDTKPISSNTTEIGRNKNRRVEIIQGN